MIYSESLKSHWRHIRTSSFKTIYANNLNNLKTFIKKIWSKTISYTWFGYVVRNISQRSVEFYANFMKIVKEQIIRLK